MLRGINHVTLTVSDLDRSLTFYQQLLGLTAYVRWEKGAYMSAGSLWFCLNIGDPKPASDYSHLAFDVSPADFHPLCTKLRNAGIREWQANRSEGNSIYFLDPDGHRLEIHTGSLKSRLSALRERPYRGLVWLNPDVSA